MKKLSRSEALRLPTPDEVAKSITNAERKKQDDEFSDLLANLPTIMKSGANTALVLCILRREQIDEVQEFFSVTGWDVTISFVNSIIARNGTGALTKEPNSTRIAWTPKVVEG